MKFRIIFIWLLLLSNLISAQEIVSNQYTPKNFKTHPIMWDAIEDDLGRIWFANNDGILRFDGNNWHLFETPFQVRSLAFGQQGELFIAGNGDFGVLRFLPDGNQEYLSIKKQLDASKQKTGGSEKVIAIGKSIYFYTANYLVIVSPELGKYPAKIFESGATTGMCSYGGKLFLNTPDMGLGTYKNGKIKIVQGGGLLAQQIIAASVNTPDGLLIASSSGGVFLFHNNLLIQVKGDLSSLATKGIVSLSYNKLGGGKIIAGTLHEGIHVFNTFAENYKADDSKLSTSSSEIYHVYSDHENNIWTSHAAGITHARVSSSVRFCRNINLSGRVTDMKMFKNELFISTTAGLYKTADESGKSLEKLAGMGSEFWDLEIVNGKIYAATTDGLYAIDGANTSLLLKGETLLRLQTGNHSKRLYAMGENGTWQMDANGKMIPLKGMPSFANSLIEDPTGNVVYVGTYQEGLKIFGATKNKLPATLQEGEVIARIWNNKTYFLKKNQVFSEETFEADEAAAQVLKGIRNTDLMIENEMALFSDEGVRLIHEGKILAASSVYSISGKPLALLIHNGSCFLATEEGVFVSNTNSREELKPKISISYLAYGQNKSAFSGFQFNKEGIYSEIQELTPGIPYEEMPLRIEFGIGSYDNPERQSYSYRIKGITKDWTPWSKQSFVELNQLSGGQYTLEAKGRTASGTESDPISFKFYIRVPWFQSGTAYLIYLVLLVLIVYGIILLNQRRLITKNRKLEEKVKERTKELQDEKAKSDELLLNILPLEVAEELKRTGGLQAKQFDEVTVIFTDFVGFTSISERLKPQELVEEIHHCFKSFDDIIGKNNLEKIKTVGDAYLAVCGMPLKDKQHAKNVINAALDIQNFMRNYQDERKKNGKPYFEIRIGCNSGPVIAGIVGVKKFAYDIWGDTVNVSARMEQNCDSGQINISGSTYELIKSDFKCSYRGKIEAKNKGKIDMYYVTAAL